MTEDQIIWLLAQTQRKLAAGQISIHDYNYPIVQFHKYKEPAWFGGVCNSVLAVEYAVVLRVEFIPEGRLVGPVKDICFQIFPSDKCGITGMILGWPDLDQAYYGEGGLGWNNTAEGVEFSTLGVVLPRLDNPEGADDYMEIAPLSHCRGLLEVTEEAVSGEKKGQREKCSLCGGQALSAGSSYDRKSTNMMSVVIEKLAGLLGMLMIGDQLRLLPSTVARLWHMILTKV